MSARSMMALGLLTLLCFLAALPASESNVDPYLSWNQGRPAEALPLLLQRAETTPHWSHWYDAGLCAAAAGQNVSARLALLRAYHLAPWQEQPQQVLQLMDIAPPPLWLSRLGPWAEVADGWWALLLCGVIGCSAAWLLLVRRQRKLALALCFVSCVALLPPLVLRSAADRAQWAVLHDDVALLDASGLPQQTLAAGTVLDVEAGATPQGQLRVRVLADFGNPTKQPLRGFIAEDALSFVAQDLTP